MEWYLCIGTDWNLYDLIVGSGTESFKAAIRKNTYKNLVSVSLMQFYSKSNDQKYVCGRTSFVRVLWICILWNAVYIE